MTLPFIFFDDPWHSVPSLNHVEGLGKMNTGCFLTPQVCAGAIPPAVVSLGFQLQPSGKTVEPVSAVGSR